MASEAPAGVRFYVAGKPVPWGRVQVRARNTNAPIHYTPRKTLNYQAHVALAAQDAMKGRPPYEGPLCLTIVACMPIPKSWAKKKQRAAEAMEIWPAVRPDIDNIEKSCLDACEEIVFADDKQVVCKYSWQRYSTNPALHVWIVPMALQRLEQLGEYAETILLQEHYA